MESQETAHVIVPKEDEEGFKERMGQQCYIGQRAHTKKRLPCVNPVGLGSGRSCVMLTKATDRKIAAHQVE